MSAIDRVRIMVLGDSGVGKTSFVHLAANSEPMKSPSWTIGCSVEVKLHEFKEGTKDQQTYFVELWDVGGSNNHRNTRHVFYSPCHGVVLIHDLTNRKSEENLHKWLHELLNRDSTNILSSAPSHIDDIDIENYIGSTEIPILVVGTKLDQLDERKFNNSLSSFAGQLGVDEIFLDCRQSRYVSPGSSNSVKMSRFYDKVIEMRSTGFSFTERYLSNPASPVLPCKFYSLHQE